MLRSAEYDHEGKRLHVFTTHAEFSRLPEAVRTMFPLIAEVPADHDIVIDFYVWHPRRLSDPEATQQEVHSMLNQAGFPRSIRRIVASSPVPAHSSRRWAARSISPIAPAGTPIEEEKFYPRNPSHDGQAAASVAAQQFQD